LGQNYKGRISVECAGALYIEGENADYLIVLKTKNADYKHVYSGYKENMPRHIIDLKTEEMGNTIYYHLLKMAESFNGDSIYLSGEFSADFNQIQFKFGDKVDKKSLLLKKTTLKKHCKETIQWASIPAGTFKMGSPHGEGGA